MLVGFEPLQQAIATVFPGQAFTVKANVADLGLQMHYSAAFRLGLNLERLEKSFLRLKRLQTLPVDAVTKADIIRASVLPAALYGSVTRTPSMDALDQLRFRISQALLGACPSVSSAVVLLVSPCQVLDPELWVYLNTLRVARSFLIQALPDTKSAFLHIAARFNGLLMRVKGPASAFGFCMRQIGWVGFHA